jgi:hypothetical protein
LHQAQAHGTALIAIGLSFQSERWLGDVTTYLLNRALLAQLADAMRRPAARE